MLNINLPTWPESIAYIHNDDLSEQYQKAIFDENSTVAAAFNMPRKVLLIGGAGYIGTVVTQHLLQRGYHVVCFDNLIYKNQSAVRAFTSYPRYSFIFGDVTCTTDLKKSLNGITDVVVLAGLVGAPITAAYPKLAEHINEKGMLTIFECLKNYPLNKVIFTSTCSVYGLIPDAEIAKETSALSPQCLYSKAKVKTEKYLLSQKGKITYAPTILRFATAFGASPRMRFDLTLNEFVIKCTQGLPFDVYDPLAWRPYCHVQDLARAVSGVFEAPRSLVDFEIFNVGHKNNVCTKKMILSTLAEWMPTPEIHFYSNGADTRSYQVDFSKAKDTLHFEPKFSYQDGIREMFGLFQQGVFSDIQSMPDTFSYEAPNYHFEEK